jgi:endonuclease/exonuclease/phosphatase family metal-dependent hydrolase
MSEEPEARHVRDAGVLRLITLNLWGTSEPLARRLELAIRQFRALDPDVIALQEVRPMDGAAAGETTAHVLGAALGMHVHYHVAVRWDDRAFAGLAAGEEGLALLTRAPLLDARALALPEARPTEARILLSGLVELSTGPTWVHTTHLHYRLDDGLAREQQVLAIDEAIRDLGRGLTDRPQLLCGDFNAEPDSDEIRFLRGHTALAQRRTHFQDAWLRCQDRASPGRAKTSTPGRCARWISIAASTTCL